MAASGTEPRAVWVGESPIGWPYIASTEDYSGFISLSHWGLYGSDNEIPAKVLEKMLMAEQAVLDHKVGAVTVSIQALEFQKFNFGRELT
jgi:hypothetical protein